MEKELYEQMLNLPALKVDKVEFTDKTIRINCYLETPSGQCPICLESVNTVKSYRTMPEKMYECITNLPSSGFVRIPD